MSEKLKIGCRLCVYGNKIGFDSYECRRRAPFVEKVPSSQYVYENKPIHPIVQADYWCGDFQEGHYMKADEDDK